MASLLDYIEENGVCSILDTDLYKFSVSYAYFKLYPLAEGTFVFKDRANQDVRQISTEFLSIVQERINALGGLALADDELNWCVEHIPYIPQTYWEWLKGFRFDPSKIKVWLDENGVFNCKVTDKLYKVTLYEIPILATFSLVRNVLGYGEQVGLFNEGFQLRIENQAKSKANISNEYGFPFSEFGTRRRFSLGVHKMVMNVLAKNAKNCVGTSNVWLAMRHNVKPCGTFPHEWVMFHGAVFGYKRANYLSLEDWIKVYDGNLGIALIDTYTTDSFLRTLTRKQALLLQGFRQDSGDEDDVAWKIINRLKKFGIDPKTKTIVFSNALDFPYAVDLYKKFSDKVNVSFGIGTNLTCDMGVSGFKPSNVVMKLMRCRMSEKDPWEECVKLSDDLGKTMGDKEQVEIAKKQLHLNE